MYYVSTDIAFRFEWTFSTPLKWTPVPIWSIDGHTGHIDRPDYGYPWFRFHTRQIGAVNLCKSQGYYLLSLVPWLLYED